MKIDLTKEEWDQLLQRFNEENRTKKLMHQLFLDCSFELNMINKILEKLGDIWVDGEEKTSNSQVALPDESNIYDKKHFTFVIKSFLKYASESTECSLNHFHYDELMKLWEKW